MSKPIVAIVGRPNVGKSTLFNQIGKQRVSIVDDMPGVTRDRIYLDAEWLGHEFTMIDTGGIELDESDHILKSMRQQAQIAMEEADVILFVVDGRAGLTPADDEVGHMLRATKKPVILAVNKVDSPERQMDIYEFYSLGLGDPIGISASNAMNLGDLLDAIIAAFPETKSASPSSAGRMSASRPSSTRFSAKTASSSATSRARRVTPSTRISSRMARNTC